MGEKYQVTIWKEIIMDTTALFNLTYGLFVAGVEENGKKNACIINTAIQATSEPNGMTVTMMKNNLTTQLICKKGSLVVSVISRACSLDVIQGFGGRSGRDVDKFEGVDYKVDQNGNPYLEKGMLSYISLNVSSILDLGTHYLFVCSVVEAENLEKGKPMSYADYRILKTGGTLDTTEETPAKKTYVCSVCHYVYDEDTPFEELPDDWTCPVCGKDKSFFMEG